MATRRPPPTRRGAQTPAVAAVKKDPHSVYTAGIKDATGKTAEYFSMEDECPICHSDRYLTPNLRLLISPCYHRMCESCIDRLYSLGSGPCPVCGTSVRKTNFMVQTFEDLVVEKEVVVRRRIAKEFNKRREDFPDLRSYNDYLEEVEDIAFNLINDIDMSETEARLAALRKENAAFTALNAQRDARDAASVQAEEERLRHEQVERANEARLLEEEERLERERERNDIIDGLQSSGDVDAAQLIARKKRAAIQAHKQRRALIASQSAPVLHPTSSYSHKNSASKNLPFVPLTDNYYTFSDRFIMAPSYNDPGTDALLRAIGADVLMAGGYNLGEAQERAIRLGVSGLGVAPLSDTGVQQTSDIIMT